MKARSENVVWVLLCVAISVVLLPRGMAAEAPTWLFPDRSLLPALHAGARDPTTHSQLVHSWHNPTAFGAGVAGEVSISAAAAVVQLAGSGPADAVIVGLEAAAFARFSLQVVTRELVNTDWIFTVPVAWHRGRHWFRWRYFHTSSHLGDEYGRRFNVPGVNFSRDGADLTAFLGTDHGLGVYGLVFWSVNSHPQQHRLWEARSGVQFDPAHGRPWQPWLSCDLHLEQGTDWDPRLTVRSGLWLPAVQNRPLRLAVEVVTGPSPMGQFRQSSESRLSLGLYWNP